MTYNYLSFGGGVNSVALYLYLTDQGIDFEAVFTHHGTDWPETYDYLAGFQWWLKSQGMRPITILHTQYYGTLIEHCERRRIVPSFMSRWCTDKFKIRLIHKYYKKPATQYIGIDYGEIHRAKIAVHKGIEDRYPLIEAEIDRQGCIDIIKSHGLPVPMKSGCYICPFQGREQWAELRRKHPCLFQRAVELEKSNMRLRKERGKTPLYLSQSYKAPLPEVVNERQRRLWVEDEYPPCQCGL